MEVYGFIKDCQNMHLTLGDVKDLQVGDELDVVIWDRNFEEYWIWNKAVENQPYDPWKFFKANRHKVTYRGNMSWNIHFNFGEIILHPIHLNTENLETNWKWCAIDETDGKIHIKTEIVKDGEEIPEHWEEKHMHWTEFPDSTRVGWRGPMMFWKELENMPKVKYC